MNHNIRTQKNWAASNDAAQFHLFKNLRYQIITRSSTGKNISPSVMLNAS